MPSPAKNDELKPKPTSSGAEVVKALLNDPQVTAFLDVLLDKMSTPHSRVIIECEPIKLSIEEARAFIAQDRMAFLTHQLEKARRAGDDKLQEILRNRMAEVAKVL